MFWKFVCPDVWTLMTLNYLPRKKNKTSTTYWSSPTLFQPCSPKVGIFFVMLGFWMGWHTGFANWKEKSVKYMSPYFLTLYLTMSVGWLVVWLVSLSVGQSFGVSVSDEFQGLWNALKVQVNNHVYVYFALQILFSA